MIKSYLLIKNCSSDYVNRRESKNISAMTLIHDKEPTKLVSGLWNIPFRRQAERNPEETLSKSEKSKRDKKRCFLDIS